MSKLRIGLIKEDKIPPDSRVALTPEDCAWLLQQYPAEISIKVQPSPGRCFPDEAYQQKNILLSDDLSDCDVLLGVKEVPVDKLIPNKTYFFFSHTIKKQPHNKKLMQALIAKRIRMIDYETLTDAQGKRLIGFGRYAGIVGAHHALRMYGLRKNQYSIKAAKDCVDYNEMIGQYATIQLPAMRVVVTGTGKVAHGAIQVLRDTGLREVSPQEYLNHQANNEALFTHLTSKELYARLSDGGFDKQEFYAHPELYRSSFLPYVSHTDILINGIFWHERIPRLFELEDVKRPEFKINTIADVTCDVDGSVPTNIRVSTIADPVYGFSKSNLAETQAFQDNEDTIDMMTVDNLPNELPRDASKGFSEVLKNIIIPELLAEQSEILNRAEICKDGKLSPNFTYLADYAEVESNL